MCRIVVGDGDLADVVQLGRADQLVELLGVQARARGRRPRRARPRRRVVVEVGSRSAMHPHEQVARLAARAAAAAALAGVHALVGQRAAPRSASRASSGTTTRPCEAPIREAVAVLAQRVDGAPSTSGVVVVSAPSSEQAELVAAEPVGAPPTRGQRGREPAQQRVAGRMAERVVVVLEAVEVEEDERVRASRVRSAARGRRSSARRLGSSVSLSVERLVAGAAHQREVLPQHQHRPRTMPANSAAAASTTRERAAVRAGRRASSVRSRPPSSTSGTAAIAPADVRAGGRGGALPGGERDRATSAAATSCRATCRRRRSPWTPGRRRTRRPARSTQAARRAATSCSPGASRVAAKGDEHDARAAAGRRRGRPASWRRRRRRPRWRRGPARRSTPRRARRASARPATPSMASQAGHGRMRSRSSAAERGVSEHVPSRGRRRRRSNAGRARPMPSVQQSVRPARATASPAAVALDRDRARARARRFGVERHPGTEQPT